MTTQSFNIPLQEKPSPTVELMEEVYKHGLHTISYHCFEDLCPYDINELRCKSNVPELVQWRHLGLIFRFIEVQHVSNAALHFERHHSTLYHAIGLFKNALNGFYPSLQHKVNMLAKYARSVVSEFPLTQRLEDNNLNLIASQIAMQNTIQITQNL